MRINQHTGENNRAGFQELQNRIIGKINSILFGSGLLVGGQNQWRMNTDSAAWHTVWKVIFGGQNFCGFCGLEANHEDITHKI